MQERWIQGLLAAHALLLVVAVAYRRNGYVQGSLFLGISERALSCWPARRSLPPLFCAADAVLRLGFARLPPSF